MNGEDDKLLELSLESLFSDEEDTVDPTPKEDLTKNMSKRINEVRAKSKLEAKEELAKELGFKDYSELQKAREKDLLEEAGLNENDVEPIIQQILEKRLAEDPRLKRLEEYEAREKNSFAEEQLKEINKVAGTQFKTVADVPKDVLAIWEKTGDLKKSYFAVYGEEMISKISTVGKNGSTMHLANTSTGGGTPSKQRPLTEYEKAIYRLSFPDISDEELSKKTIEDRR